MNDIHELVDFVILACEADMIVTSEFPWLIDLDSMRYALVESRDSSIFFLRLNGRISVHTSLM